jgi:para-aminobenzoate synthetase component 1
MALDGLKAPAWLPALSAALTAIQDAARIAVLAGDRGAVLAWLDDPLPLGGAPWPAPGAPLVAEPGWGATWGPMPAGALIVACDYEWPGVAPRIVPAAHLVRFAADGTRTIEGPDDGVRAWMAERLDTPAPALVPPRLRGWAPAWDGRAHQARVRALLDRIAAGDCYQGNLGVPMAGDLEPGPHRDLAAFLALIAASPAPFAALVRTPGRASVVSHSPECLLARRGDALASVPIKGTRRRLPGRDAAQRAELMASAKERAELAMITDLVRNDLGRIAVPGSVRVADPGFLLDLPYVHHRAARVEAVRAAGTDDRAALAALFPAGSITGAPKRKAMELVGALEDAPRGPWCGAIGWTAPGGADWAVAIRTAAIDGARVRTAAGGGIVADSDPAAEWDEVLAKSSAMAAAWGWTP